MSRELKSSKMIGGPALVALQHTMKTSAGESETLANGLPLPGHAGSVQREIERTAHPGNLKLRRDARHRVEHRRQQVGVLVRIQMSGLKPRVLHLAHLRGQLVINANSADGDLPNQLSDGGRETVAAHQNQMHADVEC